MSISLSWAMLVLAVAGIVSFMMLWPYFYTVYLIAGLVDRQPITRLKRKILTVVLVSGLSISFSLVVHFTVQQTNWTVSDPEGWMTWIIVAPNALVLVAQGIIGLVHRRTM
ncbi:MAG TPA: hypothetical protein VNG90_04980 [Candidatus Acidoferrum sp.]|nr:hypothetical protein [Candidatus Acidoferrum sp.]